MSAPVSAAELAAARRSPPCPCAVALEDGGRVEIARWLRVLPGKRLVGEGVWNGRRALAKLFIGAHSARHWRREVDGLGALAEANLPTPPKLAAGRLAGGGHYILTAFLEGARTLAERWPGADAPPPNDAEALAALRPALALFGRLHAAGLLQTDAHPGNFLEHAGEIFLIDGDGIARMRGGESERARRAAGNLALLLAQLPPDWDAHSGALLAAYAAGRPHSLPDPRALAAAVENARAKRLARFLEKTVRDCSEFAVETGARRFTAVVRGELENLAPLLADPDAAIAAGALLKDGRTCTVARAEIAGRSLVVKRYNIKNPLHALSRGLRPSRAWRAWRAGHRLAFLGVPTPAPLALVEERAGPLRRRAFLVTEFCAGENLLQRLSPGEAPGAAEAAALLDLFGRLYRHRLTHGDMKATNFLWHDGRIEVIDLDALAPHRREAAFARAWRRDRARFLANWPADSLLVRWLDRHLPEAP